MAPFTQATPILCPSKLGFERGKSSSRMAELSDRLLRFLGKPWASSAYLRSTFSNAYSGSRRLAQPLNGTVCIRYHQTAQYRRNLLKSMLYVQRPFDRAHKVVTNCQLPSVQHHRNAARYETDSCIFGWCLVNLDPLTLKVWSFAINI